jgi:hypothetical protein
VSTVDREALEYAARAAAEAGDWERVARYSARLQELDAAGRAEVIELDSKRARRGEK